MVQVIILVVSIFLVGMVGCSGPESRKAEAEAQIAEEKAKMMKQYNECLKEHEGSKDVSEKCAPYKEASETFIQK